MPEIFKKPWVYIIAGVIIILAVVGIKFSKDRQEKIPETNTEITTSVDRTTVPENTTNETTTKKETSTKETTKKQIADKTTTAKATATQSTTAQNLTSEAPLSMSKAEIVAYYKEAAALTENAGCQSKRTEKFTEVVGGNGSIGKIIGAIGKLGSTRGSTSTFDGVTGNYENLSVNDIRTATAERSGDYIIINMVPYDLVTNEDGTEFDGSVCHLITGFSDIKEAFLSDGDDVVVPKNSITLSYKNAYAKDIKIDTRTGRIVSGSWGYDFAMTMDGVQIAGFTLEGTKILANCRVVMPA